MLESMRAQALHISVRTGLKESTCLDLLLSGWSFTQNRENPDSWVSPVAQMVLVKN